MNGRSGGREWSDNVNLCPWDTASFFAACAALVRQNRLWRVRVDNASRDVFSFFFTTPLAPGRLGSLAGFDGGSVFQGTLAGLGIGTNVTGFSGSLTRAVPEPAALGMFGAGVLLLDLFVGLRSLRN